MRSLAAGLSLWAVLAFCVAESCADAASNPQNPSHPNSSHAAASTNNQASTSPPKTTQDPRTNQTVCYPVVGCFSNSPPFNNTVFVLPVTPEALGSGFWLYTRESIGNDDYDELNYTDLSSVTASKFEPKKPTKIIVHGFNNNGNTSWVQVMKDTFLKLGDFNVIVVDWGVGAVFPDYAQAVANTRLVGAQLKALIDLLIGAGLSLEDLHLIGHSLGAHTSGYAGSQFGGKVGRISGMDPAGPNFKDTSSVVRLDKSDAVFVDVTHTNADTLGIVTPSGDVDFYVNGGETQAGCPSGLLSGTITTLFGGGDVAKAVSCSHARSIFLYTESISTSCPFTAYPCSDYNAFDSGRCLTCGKQGCTQYGYHANEYKTRGTLYLKTRGKTPFCGYQYGVQLTSPDGVKETKGKLAIRLMGKWGDSGFLTVTEDVTLKPKSTLSHVVVSPVEVGDITAIEVKYIKYTGFWFGGGEDAFALSEIKVLSGENGSSYLSCLGGRLLNHNTPVRTAVSRSSSCS
ncbi:pancreatic lipase-related protein 2-like [Haliotis rufescens]|uniref:pancreatic lipase-related protein 2-like n=1 Tax=Haliotis rufescens TaxID=6454 RepID=UPI00201E7AAD|nr:pancreatic lipase-related protein 2-like [Haliotis rufescens]